MNKMFVIYDKDHNKPVLDVEGNGFYYATYKEALKVAAIMSRSFGNKLIVVEVNK